MEPLIAVTTSEALVVNNPEAESPALSVKENSHTLAEAEPVANATAKTATASFTEFFMTDIPISDKGAEEQRHSGAHYPFAVQNSSHFAHHVFERAVNTRQLQPHFSISVALEVSVILLISKEAGTPLKTFDLNQIFSLITPYD
jgi:hypothetical protein